MEFSQGLSCASESAGNDIVFVKQELEDNNIDIVHKNHDASLNEQCMEFFEERPIVDEIVENSSTAEIKQENAEDTSSAGTPDFVFVACVENVSSDEMRLQDPIGNTSADDLSDREQVTAKKQCPYCKKKYALWTMDTHKSICEWKHLYPCTLCPTTLYHKSNIKRHIKVKHSLQTNVASVDEIFEDIVAKRVELNIETAAEKINMVNEMTTNASLRAEINGRPAKTARSSQFIVPDVDIQETPREMSTQLFAIEAETKAVASSTVRQQQDVPSVVIHLTTNKRNQSVSTETATNNLEYFYCNECAHQARNKADLSLHIRMKHFAQLNLISFECPKCQKSFKSLNHLISHKANCNVKTVYSCLFCPKVLLVKANMLSHMHDQHAKEISNKKPIGTKTLVEAKKRVVGLLSVNREKQLTHKVIPQAKRKKLRGSSDKVVAIVDSNKQQKSNSSSVVIVKHDKRNNDARTLPMMTVNNEKTNNDTQNRSVMIVSEKRNNDAENRSDVIEKEQPKLFYVFCNKCIYKTTDKELLQRHIMYNQCNKLDLLERKCRNCDESFTCRDDWKSHEAACSIKTYFSCPFCTKILLRKINMVKHLSHTHSNEIANWKNDEIERLIEAKKSRVDTSVIEAQKESTKIVKNEKDSTKIVDAQTKMTKPKVRYLFCEHCRFKTHQRDTLGRHIMKKHSAELNLKQSPKDGYNYKCTFCRNTYVRIDKAKFHISQKHLSELATRTMDDIAKEMFSKRTRIGDSSKNAAGSFLDPDKVDASTLDHVLVYCDKCKTLKTTPGTLKTRKNRCRGCDSRIIYVCSKCKNSHTLNYTNFRKHWNQCQEMNVISQDYLDKLVVHKCPQCQFCTTHKYKLAMHVARSKHKGADGKGVKEDKNKPAVEYSEVYEEDKFAIRPCVVDFATMTNRYCPKCDKLVTEEMQPRQGPICQVCKTRFHAQCVKCNIRKPTWLSMRYHLNTKCFPGEYLCIKCTHRTPSWQLMQKHYVIHHTDRPVPYLCEFCSFRSTHRTNFNLHLKKMHPDKTEHIVFTREYFVPQKNIDYACDLCSFSSKHKYSLKVHLHTVHSTKKHKCKLCKFKTRYDANLKRHVLTKHQNFY